MFSEIKRFFAQYLTKRNILLVLMIFSFSVTSYEVSFAIGSDTVASAQAEARAKTDTQGSDLVKYTSEGIKGIGSFVAILTSLVTLLLHPSWYNGSLFDIDVYLHEIWILVSNVVYFIFGVILIYIALMNIIGKGGDYEIKKQLPKFIVGILIVPFSWFIIQFVLSLSSVLAAAVLSLPADTFKNFEANKAFFDDVKICTDAQVDLGGGGSSTNQSGQQSVANSFKCNSYETVSALFGKTGNGVKNEGFYGIMSVYTYGVLKLDTLNSVSINQIGSLNGITSLLNLGLKAVMDVIFVVVYLILLFALFLALFVRGIQLWIYMMISPLFGLFYYFGGSMSKLGKLSDFNLKNFIGLAMLPVYVAAALSFGVLFIAVVDHASLNTGNNGIWKNCTDSKSDCQMEVGGIKLTIKGAIGKQTSSDGNTNGVKMASNPLGYLIMQLFAIVILWTGVMAALNQSKLTNSIIKPFEEFGNHLGSAAMKLPQQIPIPGTGGLSANSLSMLGNSINEKIQEVSTKSGRDFRDKVAPWSRLESEGANDNAKKIAREIKDGTIQASQYSGKLQEALQTFNGDTAAMARSAELKDVITGIGAKVGHPIDPSKLSTEQGIVDAIKELSGKIQDPGKLRDITTVSDLKSFKPSETPQQQTQNNNVTFNFGNAVENGKVNTANNGKDRIITVIKNTDGLKGNYTEDEFKKVLVKNGINGDTNGITDIIAEIKKQDGNFFKK